MKILLIAGHGQGDCGAVGNGYQEATLTREVVSLLQSILSRCADVTVFDTSKNMYKFLKSGNKFNFKEFDYVFEVHFNAFNKTAHGTEILVHPNEKGVSVEQNIINGIAALGFTNRGVKRRTDLLNMNTCKKVQGVSYALLETCFIDNQNDMKLYQAKKQNVVQAIAKGIITGFGLKEDDAIKILKEKVGLEQQTIDYLLKYEYGNELVQKIAKAVK
jgi:N-acetylmuramoyl-L-alanine amidase